MYRLRRYILLFLFFIVLAGCSGCASKPGGVGAEFSLGENVLVNQVGYLPGTPKIAVVRGGGKSFALQNIHTGETVYTGELSAPVEDANSGDTVQHADFSAWNEAGTYILIVDGRHASYPFAISSRAYRRIWLETGRSYTLQRAGVDIRDPLTGLQIRAGHAADHEAIIFYTDDVVRAGDTVDVHGGWYDAGDFGRYIPSSAVTVAQLLLAYELNQEAFYPGQLALPEGLSPELRGGEMPDILIEVKYNLDWMERMQRPDGAVFHKASGLAWPGWITPEQDVQDRYVFGLSTFGTAQFAGAMAMASRVYRPFDPAYADRLLERAEHAFAYLEEHPEPYFRMDKEQDSGSGPYDKYTDDEERFWAAAELLKTTGARRYARYLEDNCAAMFQRLPEMITWENALALGQWAYLTSESGDAARRAALADRFLAAAAAILERIKSDGYKCSLDADDYTWASAKNAIARGNLLIMAYEIEPDPGYLHGALDQLHYILGRNTTGYSFLTGAGTRSPQNIHHRTVFATGIKIPGLLVGGPNRFGGDPLLEGLLESGAVAPAGAYLDERDSWATNEYAIDYTAPVFFALSCLANHPFGEEEETLAEPADEGEIAVDKPGTVIDDFSVIEGVWGTYTDGRSEITVSPGKGPKRGMGAIVVDYNLFQHGWLGISRALLNDWSGLTGVRFYMKAAPGRDYRVEITNYDQGLHITRVTAAGEGWQLVELPFDDFFVRLDYQHPGVKPDQSFSRDPVRAITFSPLTPGESRLEIAALEVY